MLFRTTFAALAVYLLNVQSATAEKVQRHGHMRRLDLPYGHAHSHVKHDSVPASVDSRSTASKRGIAYNDVTCVNTLANAAASGKFNHAYNWGSWAGNLPTSLNYVPMLWGPQDVHTSGWTAAADAAIAAGSTHLLSFNECDNAGQCNTAAADAATAHVKYMNPYGDKALIGAPAITNSNIAGEGLDWLKAFIESCNSLGCKIDFCAMHWYNTPSSVSTLYDQISNVSSICGGKPVWITEFAFVGASDSDVSSLLPDMLSQLDNNPLVDAYFYFFAAAGYLLTDTTTLSTSGNIYVTN